MLQDGATALWISSQMGHSPVAKELMEANADIDAPREVQLFYIIYTWIFLGRCLGGFMLRKLKCPIVAATVLNRNEPSTN